MKKSWPISIDCPNCAAKLEDALRKLPGVDDVTVSAMHQRITLEAADDHFDAVTAAVLAEARRVEPEAVIRTGEAHHDGSCCNSRHEHHYHDHDHCHDHDHAHAPSHDHGKGDGHMLLRAVAAGILTAAALLLGNSWPAVIIFLAAYLIAGWDVLLTAGRNILRGNVFDENFLMAVASLGALIMGEYAEGVAVMALYQVGEHFQHKAVDHSRASITALMDVRPDRACVLRGESHVEVHPSDVAPGETILVRPGEKIPLDGVVLEGDSNLNTTALTGESMPRSVHPGDSVLSGCVNLSGLLTIRVSAVYAESTVAKILRLVESASDAKATTERFITRFSRVYTPLVCLAALLLAVAPSLFTGHWQQHIYSALTFLVISCPCALVISVPLTFFSGIGGASRRGVLIKGANHLETLAQVDAVALDKTGTLTRGVFEVSAVHPMGMSEAQLLEIAAHAECWSDHPISQSLKQAYQCNADASRVQDASETAGHGVSALVDGRRVLAGSSRLLGNHGLDVPQVQSGGTVVHVAVDGAYAGHIVINDALRSTSIGAIAALRDAGVKRIVMLTGDREEAAKAISAEAGLTEYRAGLLPGDKVSAVEELLADGHRTAFVGDGINDAPVLRRADLGVAMGGMGSDAAIEAADVVLMNDDLTHLATGRRIAVRTMRIARQNIAFALGVKALVMVLGVMGVASMWLAVFADVGVAMLAILNAMRAMHLPE